MQFEQSVVLVKPDGLQRGLVGQIITRFERKGLKLVAMKMIRMSDAHIEEWYSHHVDKPFFPQLKCSFRTLAVVAMLWEGIECAKTVRELTGTTKAREAESGSIRGDYAMSQQLNLIHASDSVANAKRERDIIFEAEDIFDYERNIEVFVYSADELDG